MGPKRIHLFGRNGIHSVQYFFKNRAEKGGGPERHISEATAASFDRLATCFLHPLYLSLSFISIAFYSLNHLNLRPLSYNAF